LLLQEWEYAKKRQDMQLDRIERGVGTLADMAKGMQVRAAQELGVAGQEGQAAGCRASSE